MEKIKNLERSQKCRAAKLPNKVFALGTTAVAAYFLLCPARLKAQDVQPRVYSPAPVGVNLFTLGYAFSTGAVLFDKTIAIEDATAEIHSITAAYSRSIGLFGMAGRADVALPLVTGDWAGVVAKTVQTTSRTGFGDPVLRFALFFFGAPALTPEEFRGSSLRRLWAVPCD